jgi:hypothetical protein
VRRFTQQHCALGALPGTTRRSACRYRAGREQIWSGKAGRAHPLGRLPLVLVADTQGLAAINNLDGYAKKDARPHFVARSG